MGCGTSSNVMPISDEITPNDAAEDDGKKTPMGKAEDQNGDYLDKDGVPTMMLPDVTSQKKPPIAFEIPVNEQSRDQEPRPSPPPRIQQMIEKQTEAPTITLPEIEEKLGEAEIRRQLFLMQRAASASRRAKKNIKLMAEMDHIQNELEKIECMEEKISAIKTVKFSTSELKVNEDRNI